MRGVWGRFQGKNHWGGLGGEGVGEVGDSGGDIFGDFNFLFFSLAVQLRNLEGTFLAIDRGTRPRLQRSV